MFQVLQYLKFLWSSKNQHGVHSPFVYQLITKCLYDNIKYAEYSYLKAYRNRLLKVRKTISIDDLGAGSRISNGSERKISEMAKNAGSSLKQAQLLFRLVKFFKPESILELGTSLGVSTLSLGMAYSKARIITVEGSKGLFEFTKNQPEFKSQQIFFLNDSFKNYLESLGTEKFDFVFLDGDHTKDGTLEYFEMLLPYFHNDSILLIDDIYWSKGMKTAWEVIQEHPQTKITVDLFYKGLVFFRREQQKEHFKIRL